MDSFIPVDVVTSLAILPMNVTIKSVIIVRKLAMNLKIAKKLFFVVFASAIRTLLNTALFMVHCASP